MGVVPFGFLLRFRDDGDYPYLVHAYDNEANSIGAILTDAISEHCVSRVTYIDNNLYAFKLGKQLKIIQNQH
jgi:hypothetical protein